jgi:hypothetical protein
MLQRKPSAKHPGVPLSSATPHDQIPEMREESDHPPLADHPVHPYVDHDAKARLDMESSQGWTYMNRYEQFIYVYEPIWVYTYV